MNTEIGYTYKTLTSEEIATLAPLLNSLSDRYLYANDDGSFTILASVPDVKTKEEEIRQLKQYLADTDYQVIKCYDRGLVYAEQYPEDFAKRQEARDKINELEN